jgi:hypothetical protein
VFGIVHQRKRFIAGHKLTGTELVEGVEWRNGRFERCDGVTKRRLAGAARHSEPEEVNRS